MKQVRSRSGEITRVSRYGIAVNIVLVLFKAAVGLAAHSIAVVLDAVNNLTDAVSSLITIIGTKLAGKAADRKHPYGHGRIEYIAATLVALMILTAGLTSLKESINKLLHPEALNYTFVSVIVILGALAAKVLLGTYYRRKGTELNSDSLKASGTDALFDAVISLATLISAVVSMTFGLNLEGVLGIVISLLILKAGLEIITGTISRIIGTRTDDALTAKIREVICADSNVRGVYDLILHNYGPETYFGSVHIEVDDNMSAREIDALSRSLAGEIYRSFSVLMTFGIYAANTHNETAVEIRSAVNEITGRFPAIRQVHGFYLEEFARIVSFDILLDYDINDPDTITDVIRLALAERFPDYDFYINIDRDFSE